MTFKQKRIQRQKKKLNKLLCQLLKRKNLKDYKITLHPIFPPTKCCANCVFYKYDDSPLMRCMGYCDKHTRATTAHKDCEDFYCPSPDIKITL